MANGEGAMEVDDVRAALKALYGDRKCKRSLAATHRDYAAGDRARGARFSDASDNETDKENDQDGGNDDVARCMYCCILYMYSVRTTCVWHIYIYIYMS